MKTKVKGTVLARDGSEIHPQGKHYIVFAVVIESKENKLPEIDPDDSKFSGTTVKLHSCHWVDPDTAKDLIKKIENPTKRNIAERAIDLITKKGLC